MIDNLPALTGMTGLPQGARACNQSLSLHAWRTRCSAAVTIIHERFAQALCGKQATMHCHGR